MRNLIAFVVAYGSGLCAAASFDDGLNAVGYTFALIGVTIYYILTHDHKR